MGTIDGGCRSSTERYAIARSWSRRCRGAQAAMQHAHAHYRPPSLDIELGNGTLHSAAPIKRGTVPHLHDQGPLMRHRTARYRGAVSLRHEDDSSLHQDNSLATTLTKKALHFIQLLFTTDVPVPAGTFFLLSQLT